MQNLRNSERKIIKKNKNSLNSIETKQLVLLREIVDNTKATAIGSYPNVRDVAPIRLSRNKVYTFYRSNQRSTATVVTGVDTSIAMTFSLADLSSSSEFAALFDEYRIIQLRVFLEPVITAAGGNTYNNLPPIYTCIDPDDGIAPANLDTVLQFDTCQVDPVGGTGRIIERCFMPKFSMSAYSGAFTSFTNVSPYTTWIDTASLSVQHYGLKVYWPNWAFAGTVTVQLRATVGYVIQCRKPA